MSKILTFRDTITITIDNTKNPVTVSMALSRDYPTPMVIGILTQLATQLAGEMMIRIQAGLPPINPEKTPEKNA